MTDTETGSTGSYQVRNWCRLGGILLAVVLAGCATDTKLVEICKVERCVCMERSLLMPTTPSPIRFREGTAYCASGYRMERVRQEFERADP